MMIHEQPPAGCIKCGRPVRTRKAGEWRCWRCERELHGTHIEPRDPRELRLRRLAARQGKALVKSPVRDERAPDYGRWGIVRYDMTIEEVEAKLLRKPEG